MNNLQGSQLGSHVDARSLPRHVPGTRIAAPSLQICHGLRSQHRHKQIYQSPQQLSNRRSSRLNQLVGHDSASSTWPSESSEAFDDSETTDKTSVPDTRNGVSKSDLENSTDEAATRVGPSSKGSKKLAGFWKMYSKALEEHPIRIKSATSFFGFLVGDAVAQLVVGNPYNYMRTARMVIFGILMDGPIGHLWYSFLDSKVYPEDPKSNKAVISKMLCDQVLWAPFFSCVFFAVIKTLEGTPSLIIPTIKAKLIKTLLANYAIWPLAHIINFKFIPSSQRILYINCVQVVWSAYLSNMSSRA